MILPPDQSPRIESPESLQPGASALFRNLYIVKRPGAKVAVVAFNGAKPFPRPNPLFNRWSWADDLRCHLIVCNDAPAEANHLVTTWYVGAQSADFLAENTRNLKCALRALGNPKILLFGTSAGGFAALMTGLRGFGDHALAINPQTDLLRFHDKSRLDSFLQWHGPVTQASRLSILKSLPEYTGRCSIEIRQCLGDRHHYREHFTPFCRAISNHPMKSRVQTHTFQGKGHDPPAKSICLEWIGAALEKLVSGSTIDFI